MEIYQGAELREFVHDTLIDDFKERFILKDLHSYITSKNNQKVCCLYGLRRTGKTIMALQEIRNLDDYERCLFISCEKADTIHQVKDAVKDNPCCKYIFIDEATKPVDFIDTCAFLADAYAVRGIKVVLSGTDTLGFVFAKNDELYGRVNFLHTTYIPFNEYNYLLGRNLKSYIKHGGTLTVSDTFYNKEKTDEYSDTAIVHNILHSLERWEDGINYANQVLRPIIEKGELVSFINKVIEYPSREFLSKIINDDFIKSHDLGSLRQLAKSHNIGDPDVLKNEELTEQIREALEIKGSHFSKAEEQSVQAIIKYLKEMDVLYEIPKASEFDTPNITEYIFTQVGMRYWQANALAKVLVNSSAFNSTFSKEEKKQLLKKLNEDICGGILEDIVFYQLAKDLGYSDAIDDKYKVVKYRNIENQEIDILVLGDDEKSILALEVKNSSAIADGQRKHLTNNIFCSEIEGKAEKAIANRVVIYLGENGETSDGVLYINAEDYLKQSEEMTQVLLKYPNIETFKQLEQLVEKDFLGNADKPNATSKGKTSFDLDR